MKAAFAGKGGAGKTTLAALFCLRLAKKGRKVLAVDCDPDSNLGTALGFKDAGSITPIVQNKTLLRERMGVSEGSSLFRLNPRIDDIPDKFSLQKGRVRLIVMGSVARGGGGCVCPENEFIKNLIEHLFISRGEDCVMDMEAGVEHFGRGTAAACDCVLVVVEPSAKSVESARRIGRLAGDIGIRALYAVGNKVRGGNDCEFIKKGLKGAMELIECLPFSGDVLALEKSGDISGVGGDVARGIENIVSVLTGEVADGKEQY